MITIISLVDNGLVETYVGLVKGSLSEAQRKEAEESWKANDFCPECSDEEGDDIDCEDHRAMHFRELDDPTEELPDMLRNIAPSE